MEPIAAQLELLSQQVHQAHRNAVAAELAARGLSEVGHPMLMTILKYLEVGERGCSQRELAQMLHISPAAVANSLKSMEKIGYIRREPEPEDARRNRVFLTEKGRNAVEGCEAAFLAVSERMLAGFTMEEQELLTRFRSRMLQNLRGMAPGSEEEEPCFNCF